MRRVCLGVSAISTFLFASCPENPANAMTLGAPAAMRTAIVDIAVTYRAHCRPGRVCTIDIGPMMDVPKDMSVPPIIIVITAAVGHQTRHTTTYLTPSRAQWEATVAGTNRVAPI